MFLMCYPMGMAADYLRFKDLVSTETSRKLFNSIGMIGPGLCMILLGFVGCNSTLAVGILVASTSISAAGNMGFNVRMCGQGFTIRPFLGLVNFATAVAQHFCLNLLAATWERLFSEVLYREACGEP